MVVCSHKANAHCSLKKGGFSMIVRHPVLPRVYMCCFCLFKNPCTILGGAKLTVLPYSILGKCELETTWFQQFRWALQPGLAPGTSLASKCLGQPLQRGVAGAAIRWRVPHSRSEWGTSRWIAADCDHSFFFFFLAAWSGKTPGAGPVCSFGQKMFF